MPTHKDFERPDVDLVLAPLKDFQRETVDYVSRRLYTDPDRCNRFLVADEVGLGKTLVARGVIARAIDHLWDSIDRIDIVYICSSGDIARQNVNRLNITGRPDWALASRVTLLPTQLKDIKSRKVNFIAFTPGTSFSHSSGAGQKRERVLLYWLLESVWDLRGTGPLNLLQGWVTHHDRFRRDIDAFSSEHSVDPLLQTKFHEAIKAREAEDRSAGRPTFKQRFDEVATAFSRARKHIPIEERRAQTGIIGDLRRLLASTCIRALEPDLVILDEFQRFKDLLVVDDDKATDESRLAHELFDYTHGTEKTRILLLSATPYKMYTIADEAEGEDHYVDFIRTLEFLHDDPTRTARVAELLQRYRRELYRLADPDNQLATLKGELERELRAVMARTERLAASPDRNGMLREIPAPAMTLEADDALAYRDLQRVAKEIDHPETVEYWKAAPHLLSFMDDYILKRRVEEALTDDDANPTLAATVRESPRLFLPRNVLHQRAELVPAHPRTRWLIDTCLAGDAWKLLWIPTTLPYYRPEGPFADRSANPPTKRLLFSAWHVVPKAVAAILSYEVERRMLAGFGGAREGLTNVRASLVPLLRFARNRVDDRLTGMPVLGMIYPAIHLAAIGDPLSARTPATPTTKHDLLASIAERIERDLAPIITQCATESTQEDESWYWAAPILLDVFHHRAAAREWLNRPDVAERWSGEERTKEHATAAEADAHADRSAWDDHVLRARDVVAMPTLGRPPADLPRVMAELALAGPGVAALRALGRIVGGPEAHKDSVVRDSAGRIAWSIRNLFNLPEVRALIQGADSREPYWRRVVEYAIDGNLQAVLDEYAHLLRDSLGLALMSPPDTAEQVAETMRAAVGLRTAAVGVDELTSSGKLKKERMRARFAVRFGDEAQVEGQEANRKDAVRSAFNSPFWPFVLATTSVGQEGLDFHLYCHAVVHWNLPNNPVDLEQREGRVHRFKGHAVRKNVASAHGTARNGGADPWEAVFDAARAGRAEGSSDIAPYWIYPLAHGAAIERHVPSLPLSRDEKRLKQLQRTLAVYRMVFGQPRQDELLEYLLRYLPADAVGEQLAALRIDVAPPRTDRRS